jgi:hypothetical protein
VVPVLELRCVEERGCPYVEDCELATGHRFQFTQPGEMAPGDEVVIRPHLRPDNRNHQEAAIPGGAQQ